MRLSLTVLAAAALATACAHSPEGALTPPAGLDTDPDPAVDTSAELRAQYEQALRVSGDDLAALADLDVMSDVTLLSNQADAAFNCYGPCPDADQEVAAFVAQVERLHVLTARAVDAAEQAAPDTCPVDAVDDNLAALRALDVIEMSGFLAVEAETSPYCYNLPCPEQQAAADAETCTRAAQLDAITAAVSDL